ncbi:TonB-dependent receptor [Dyadobacter sp. 676]|uniref:TonB-dependent receptor n=1 Tax=Dyadobacter sp. 676 TaxID=3088362 RepID=A0AAU8FHD2_9BACT
MRNALPYPSGGKRLRFSFWIAACLLISTVAVGRNGSRPEPRRILFVDKLVKGRITDEKSQPLVGVNIVVKGTSIGTTSDADGRFELNNLSENQVLVFSFIGYVQQEIAVRSQTTIDVQLVPNAEQLSEVVVVGYGTVQKKDLTGAIATIAGKDIEQGSINTPDKALQGKIAGVQVNTNSHAPGGGISVQVRGTASLSASGSPLYVIDGVPISNGFQTGASSDAGSFGGNANPMNSIDPSDIESVQILKDASASAIYGSRAANGVVLITTRRGKTGQQRVDFEYAFGLQTIRKKLDFMNATQWATQVNERAALLGQSQVYTPDQIAGFGQGTDWQSEIYNSAPRQNFKLSFSGGGQSVRYMLAENVTLQDGIIPGSNFRRYGTTINIDADISKKLRVGQSLLFTLTDENVVPTDTKGYEGISNVVDAVYEAPPTIPARDESGQPANLRNFPMGGGLENPLTMTEKYRQLSNTMRILGNIYADYSIIPGLDLNIRFGADIRDWKFHQYFPIGSEAAAGANGKARQIGVRNLNFTNANTLTYSKTFNDIHNLKILAGFTYQKEKNETVDASSFGFPSDIFEYYNLGLGSSPQAPGSNMNEWTLISYLGRLNYSLKDKYLFTASVRSLSLLGTSFGTRSSYIFGGARVPIAFPSNIANPDLSWEKTGEFNVGLDAAILNGRLSFTVDYYHKKTTDLLLDVPIPSQTGYGSVLKNTGAMLNKGWEFGINSVNTSGKLNWTTNFNISFNRNEILSLGGAEYLYSGWVGGANVNPHAKNTVRLQPGHSVGEFYGSVYDGIWRSKEEIQQVGTMPAAKPGDIRYKDVNGDGTYDTELDDVFLGSPLPKFSYGLTNDLSFGPLSVHVFVYGMQGNKVLNLAAQQYVLDGIGVSARRLDRWTPENPAAAIPAASASHPQRVSSFLVEDGSFLRIQNVSLSYKIPGFASFVKNARIGIGVDNLALITEYSGYDPEVNSFGSSNTTKGMDRFGYPSSRTYRVEIKLGF